MGSHTITAVYGGDANFAGSTSSPLAEAVVQQAATTISLGGSPATVPYGSALVATVSAVAPSTAAPTGGTVTFLDGSTPLGTATLSGGTAVLACSPPLGLGSHTITAVYGGTANYAGSTSAPLAEAVVPAATKVSLSVSATAITYGQAETLTATVSTAMPSTVTPTGGTVTFTDQTTSATLGTATLTAGTAAITINSLTAGKHTILAAYHGDGLDF